MDSNRFATLKQEMKKNKIDKKYLGKLVGLSESTIFERLSCRKDWKLSEVYAISKELGYPPDKAFELFPPEGLALVPEEEPSIRQQVLDVLADMARKMREEDTA